MNIILTTRCNRSCSFCFAKDTYAPDMSLENVQKVLDFQKINEIHTFRILGGEPTLHPQFVQIVELARSQGFSLFMMSNCIMSKDIVDYLSTIEIEILCNISPQATDSPKAVAKRTYALATLQQKIVLGITVTQPAVNFHTLIDTINEFNLYRCIRVGIAQPICTYVASNIFLHPLNYNAAGAAIAHMSNVCADLDIHVAIDCGFVLCMFPDRGNVNTSLLHCNPVLDVDPQLNVFYCFPLSAHTNVPLSDYTTIEELTSFFTVLHVQNKQLPFIDECETCEDVDKCTRGCLAHKIK